MTPIQVLQIMAWCPDCIFLIQCIAVYGLMIGAITYLIVTHNFLIIASSLLSGTIGMAILIPDFRLTRKRCFLRKFLRKLFAYKYKRRKKKITARKNG